jgi:hypothetical protein
VPDQPAPSNLAGFAAFITEREEIRLQKENLEPPPWTKDPILGRFRFCNVNRQHDPVTIAIQRHLAGLNNHPLLFNAVVARLYNNPHTLRALGHLPASEEFAVRLRQVADDRIAKGQKLFNPAYIVSTNGVAMEKTDYLIERVLMPLATENVRWLSHLSTCGGTMEYLRRFNGIGAFIANQVVTDLKYLALKGAPDWSTSCLAGPGTLRGLSRLAGRPVDQKINQTQALEELKDVRLRLARHPLAHYFKDLNNLSNCFCEWDKYERARLGQGKPKQRYEP